MVTQSFDLFQRLSEETRKREKIKGMWERLEAPHAWDLIYVSGWLRVKNCKTSDRIKTTVTVAYRAR